MKIPNLKNSTLKISNHLWNSFAILFFGLLITFCVSHFANQEEEFQSKKDFVLTCNEIKAKISRRLNLNAQFLFNGSSFFEASVYVTRKEWGQFNEFSIINQNFKGVQGFGFVSLIKKGQLQKHIHEVRKQGFLGYQIYPMGIRDTYAVIKYIEPVNSRNARALGFDMFTDPVRRKTMEEARDYNRATLSGKTMLRQETNQDVQAGSLMFVPFYSKRPNNTVANRRELIMGWIYSPFRMDDFINSIIEQSDLGNNENIRLQIYDTDTISQKTLLFDNYKNRIGSTIELNERTRIIPLFFNKKRWTLVFTETSENTFVFSVKILMIAIGGMIISLLLFALSYSLLITKQRAKIIAGRLSLDLSNKNQEYERINTSLSRSYKKLISSKEKLKGTNKELQKSKAKAEESDQLKSAFLANMSHEIRTPMNGIMGFSELLKEANLNSEEQKDYIEIIKKSGTRLLNIINDIVDISKIEAGQMNVVFTPTNIDEELQYIHAFFNKETQDKGIQLVLEKALDGDETIIRTDREKLYAILINLVKNAIKYTVNGNVEFGYEKKEEYIEFFVKDTGIGISKDRHDAIFERFIQADFNDKMARQGAGLGLSIAKAYVELLGGKMWVESELDKGSVFYFTIPSKAKLEENCYSQINKQPIEEDCQIKKLKILIAEDDKISRMLILKILESFSKEIIIAKTGLEAVEKYKANPDIDLILMDIQMPEMNGYDATKQIRKKNKKVIILAQTAFALEGDKEKTIEAGCNDYISKPIKKEELSRLIQLYFGKKNSDNSL